MAEQFLVEPLGSQHDRETDAVQRSLRSEVAVFALVVDAKDDEAEALCRHHGFVSLASRPRQLVLPLTNLVAR